MQQIHDAAPDAWRRRDELRTHPLLWPAAVRQAIPVHERHNADVQRLHGEALRALAPARAAEDALATESGQLADASLRCGTSRKCAMNFWRGNESQDPTPNRRTT